jgi:hypothetical protein
MWLTPAKRIPLLSNLHSIPAHTGAFRNTRFVDPCRRTNRDFSTSPFCWFSVTWPPPACFQALVSLSKRYSLHCVTVCNLVSSSSPDLVAFFSPSNFSTFSRCVAANCEVDLPPEPNIFVGFTLKIDAFPSPGDAFLKLPSPGAPVGDLSFTSITGDDRGSRGRNSTDEYTEHDSTTLTTPTTHGARTSGGRTFVKARTFRRRRRATRCVNFLRFLEQ